MAERFLKRKQRKSGKAYFFIDKRLHRVLKRNIPANLVEAWSFEDHAVVKFLYTDFQKKCVPAYRTKEVADMLNVSTRTLKRMLAGDNVRLPVKSYPIGNQTASEHNSAYWWGLWNILEAHEYLLTVHYGRPRKDGEITPNQRMPNRAEVIARAERQVVLFSKEDAQTYVPQYRPPQF